MNQSGGATRLRSRRSATRRIEFFLFAVAAVLLSIYAGVLGYSRFSQAYYDWAFNRLVRDKPAPMTQFLRETLFGGSTASTQPDDTKPSPPARKSHQFRAPGSIVGRLEIPAVGLSVMVIEGTGSKALASGVGHIEGTALPGQPGNSGLAGHRDTYFRALKDISKSDVINLTTMDGTFRYSVEQTRVVYPSAVSVLDATREPTLTLVTCFPFYYVGDAPKRFVVKARLIG